MIGVLSVLASILVIALIVCLHECGHFLAARAVGVPVAEFSIGFGPRLASFKPGETEFSIRLLPLGGYVRFYGDDGEESPLDGVTDKYLNRFPVWKRAVIMASGVIANVLSAVIVTLLLLCLIGQPASANVIAQVEDASPAAQAGILPGDVIESVNGAPTADGQTLVTAIGEAGLHPIALGVLRDGQRLDMTLTPFYDQELERARVGITLDTTQHRYSFFEAVPLSFNYVRYVVVETVRALKMMIFGQVETGDIYGIVGTVSVMSQGVRSGLDTTMRFFILISANLAVMNILPIPGLDGCKLVFLAIEAIRGKPMDPNKEGIVHLIGFALIALLAIALTYNDIVRLITGG